MARCTWEGCQNEAKHPCVARDGEKWADLCDEHKVIFDEAPAKGVKQILGVWVKAQGGPKRTAARFGVDMSGTTSTRSDK